MLRKAKLGRHYEDFVTLLSTNPELTYLQMDTVEGVKGGKVCLSLKVIRVQFQFYFLLEDKSALAVVNKLNEIQKIIGLENYEKYSEPLS